MDQIPSTDNDEVNDECDLQYNSVVNSTEGNISENFPNLIDNEITSGSSNDDNKSSEKPSDSLLDAESRTGENDVSSTSCIENEVIPNENGPVVNQHSTCEVVQDFEKSDNFGSVEAECSSMQANVDEICADSNTNNSVEEFPSASDHIELPSVSDHIELPASDRIELPSASDHIELPSASDHELPSSSDHIELPSPSDLVEQPAASIRIELPLVSDHNNLSPVSTSPCPVLDTNAEGNLNTEAIFSAGVNPLTDATEASSESPETEAVSNVESICNSEIVTNAQSSSNIGAVTNAEASAGTEISTNALPSPTEDVTNTKVSPSSGTVTDAEVSADAQVVANALDDPTAEVGTIAVADPTAEIVTNAVADPTAEIVTNAVTDPTAEIVTNAVADPTAEIVTNAVANPTAEVATTGETSLTTEVIPNAETSPATKVVDNAEVSPTEDVTNSESSHQLNEVVDDLSEVQNVCDSPGNETYPVNDETLDRRSNFLPTIVAIRGGCTDVLQKTSDPSSSNSVHEDVSSSTPPAMPSLNIVSVLGGCREVDPGNEISKINVENDTSKTSDLTVQTISDSEGTDALNNCSDCPVDIDVTIKQEPLDNFSENDNVRMATENGITSVSSKFPIKEDKMKNVKVEDPDVICVEATAEIPTPIPIKTESSIDSLNVEAESRSPKKNGKFTARKRLTRSSLSQSDDCIILSSSSDVDCVSDSKKRNRQPKNAPYSTAGYTCHLCDTVFHEHELLNEHMILHRNNSLIEAKVQNRAKATKMKVYSCDICQKQLSTSQSLQQHVLIHKNEKPYVCSICQKDFRHLQNYRIHQQNHKVEQHRHGKPQKGIKEQLDKSVVRGTDFGRLVGPLFMKENLWHQKDTSSSKNVANAASSSNKTTAFRYVTNRRPVSHQPRLSFDLKPFKSNPSNSSPVIIRKREPSPESRSDEECVAVKSFCNIESVVMNAAKIIVKLDNVDTSVLKRKLQTPDISIDQAPKKCRIMLSPIAERCNIRLDEIENIPMDTDVGEIDSPAAEQMEGEVADSSVRPPTLTDNELFDLLNDDSTSTDAGDRGSISKSQISKPEHCNISDSSKPAGSPSPKRSNVIFMEAPARYEMCAYEDEEALDNRLDDAFDTAFQKVAARRLALLRKRASENGGKLDSRYLLGPLFWHKALRRAQKGRAGNAVANVDITFSSSKNGSKAGALRMRSSQFGGRSRFDNRQTNDPTKLQLRAERKFKYLLELAKMLSDLSTVNLAGPLFWRQTLQLAGVHRAEDLRMHVNVSSPTLDDVEFVNDSGQLCDFGAELVNAEGTSVSKPLDPVQPSPLDHQLSEQVETSNPVQPLRTDPVHLSPYLCVQPSEVPAPSTTVSKLDGQSSDATGGPPLTNNVVDGNVSKMQTATAHPQPPSYDAATENTSNGVASLKTDSILYESLTRPKEKQPSTAPEGVPPSYADSTSVFVANQGTAAESSLAGHSKADGQCAEMAKNTLCDVVENCAPHQNHSELTGDVAVDEGIAKLAVIDSGSIVLNVDNGGGLQLIPAGDQVPMAGARQNYVLVSDGSGTMQYMVNVPGDNFDNFELIGNAAGAEQVAYAIQFDGENYAAVQFVQDGGGIQLQSDGGLKEAQMLVDPKAATYLMADAGAAAAAVADPNHIGKELSDFLNLDYGNLLKNGNADQSIS